MAMDPNQGFAAVGGFRDRLLALAVEHEALLAACQQLTAKNQELLLICVANELSFPSARTVGSGEEEAEAVIFKERSLPDVPCDRFAPQKVRNLSQAAPRLAGDHECDGAQILTNEMILEALRAPSEGNSSPPSHRGSSAKDDLRDISRSPSSSKVEAKNSKRVTMATKPSVTIDLPVDELSPQSVGVCRSSGFGTPMWSSPLPGSHGLGNQTPGGSRTARPQPLFDGGHHKSSFCSIAGHLSAETNGWFDRSSLTSHFQDQRSFPEWWFCESGNPLRVVSVELREMVQRDADDAPQGSLVLNPVGHKRLSWDMVSFVLLMFQLWLIFFEMCLLEDVNDASAFLKIIWDFATGFFALDMVLNFSTGFVDLNGQLIMSRGAIIRNYFACWFWLDFISTFPFDLALGTGSAFALMRFTKTSKVLKTLRFLKALRALRLVKALQTRSTSRANQFVTHFLHPLRFLAVPFKILFVLLAVSHVNGCIVGNLRYPASTQFEDALQVYVHCISWAFAAFINGPVHDIPDASEEGWTPLFVSGTTLFFNFFVNIQRLGLLAGAFIFGGAFVLRFQESAHFLNLKRGALEYMRKHEVGIDSQIQVVHSLQETHEAKQLKIQYESLMTAQLPNELQMRISKELWSRPLLSLDLVSSLAKSSSVFLDVLVGMVQEEVFASRTFIFVEGELCSAAYHVLRGSVGIRSMRQVEEIDPFKVGQWIGEKALVNPSLHRSGTAVASELSSMLMVPAKEFQDLIERSGLEERFASICEYQLPFGLCGRCGELGDHFTDNCVLEGNGKRPARQHMSTEKARTEEFLDPDERGVDRSYTKTTAQFNLELLSLDLQGFLREQELIAIAPDLSAANVSDLEGLVAMDLALLTSVTERAKAKLSRSQVRRYQKRFGQLAARILVDSKQHFIFMSHCKMDAGTEAALVVSEVEDLLKKNPTWPGASYEVPVFLDSENLTDLKQLQELVRNCTNLVLMCTTNVLSRPWCLVEIVTAMEAGVPILPLSVQKPGNDFAYPDAEFYDRFYKGSILDEAAIETLCNCGIDLERTIKAIKHVFTTIALPYSPHKSKLIREAELRAMLTRLRPGKESHDDHGKDRSARFESQLNTKTMNKQKTRTS